MIDLIGLGVSRFKADGAVVFLCFLSFLQVVRSRLD